jgi:exopolysaccharide biosynthesis polyprenyl glycosylphosphotransferase
MTVATDTLGFPTLLQSLRERILIIGSTPLAWQIARELQDRPSGRYVLAGMVQEPAAEGADRAAAEPRGTLADLPEIVEKTRPDRVLVALGERRRRTPIRVLVESCLARGIVVEDAAEFYERMTGQLAIESLTPTSLVYARRFGPSRSGQLFSRILSLVVAILGLTLLSPLFALIAIAVKLDSKGPVFFVHERIGRHGRPFSLLKFRTMHEARSTRSEWERDNRDRVTRVGRILRAFRLDELPQFVNILRGEMNLVGPRPHPASNYELFTLVARNLNQVTGNVVDYYSLRTMVPPGITGWAQVRYQYANDLDEEIEKLRYDLYYVKHFSAAMDVRILAGTVFVMLKGHPAGRRAFAAAVSQPPVSQPAVSLAAPINTTQAA